VTLPIDFAVLRQSEIDLTTFKIVDEVAEELHRYLDEKEAQQLLLERHILGTSSAAIQEIVLTKAHQLGFEDEKKGLFATYEVSALRPDYFRPVGDTGILLEVERGKTTTNNMDLLDLWKCHICHHASYLFLVVPKFRMGETGPGIQQFSYVRKRLAPFFEPQNYVNVEAVFLFGY
jgi:hypothetical protein